MNRATLAALLALAAPAAGCASPAEPASAPAEAAAPPAVAVAAPAPAPAPEFPAGSDDEARSAAAFERFLALAGEWSGEFGMGDSKGPGSVHYRVTGGGSAVEETLFRGTPHEMVTMYHRDGPRLLLTHYCAAGNQPTMVLVPGDDPAVLRFQFLRGTNMKSPEVGHMHEAVFDFRTAGRLRTTWTYWEGGKAGHAANFDLERAAAR